MIEGGERKEWGGGDDEGLGKEEDARAWGRVGGTGERERERRGCHVWTNRPQLATKKEGPQSSHPTNGRCLQIAGSRPSLQLRLKCNTRHRFSL
jgi:hypothetical protein